MKAARFLLLLLFLPAVSRAVVHAQNSAAPSADVTIGLSEGAREYCLGPMSSSVEYLRLFQPGQDPDDITLRLPLKLRYENHRSETIFLPFGHRRLTRMTVAGQNGSTLLRDATASASGLDVKSLMALSSPQAGPFWTVAGGKDISSPKFSVLKFKDTVEVSDSVFIPVLVRSSGLDLRGKTVQIATSRDFGSIAPEVVEKLNEKWKDYGTVWAQVVESDTVTLHIPEDPPTRNCIPPSNLLPR